MKKSVLKVNMEKVHRNLKFVMNKFSGFKKSLFFKKVQASCSIICIRRER